MRLLPAMKRMAGIFCRREDYLLERTNLLPSTSLKMAEVLAGATELLAVNKEGVTATRGILC
jgi:hypothetical protein